MTIRNSDYYPDCESCAFRDENHAICDMCEDADQWEPGETEDSLNGAVFATRIIKVHKRTKFKEKLAA